MVVLEVTLTLAAIAVCGTGVAILACCVAWLKRSESVWTKAEKEEIRPVKKERKKEEPGCLKTKVESLKQTGFTNLTAYEIPVRSTGITNTSGPAANSVEIAQNEDYIQMHHLTHIQEDGSQVQVADVKGTANSEIKTVQNTSYRPTHSHTTEQGHTSSANTDESMYTYISSEEANCATMMNMASNVAYQHVCSESCQHTLDVIYEETPPESVVSSDKTRAPHNTRSETLL